MYSLVKVMSLHREVILFPETFDMDEIPLSRAENIVLDTREGEHLVLGVHGALDEVE